ncbi:hypothetical protein CEN47_07445, partial [Fischerella thermalis CCMEE 5319]
LFDFCEARYTSNLSNKCEEKVTVMIVLSISGLTQNITIPLRKNKVFCPILLNQFNIDLELQLPNEAALLCLSHSIHIYIQYWKQPNPLFS